MPFLQRLGREGVRIGLLSPVCLHLQACLHNGEVVQALQAITWEQRDWSHHVLVMAMDWMAACTSDELIRSVDGIARLVTVQDNYLKVTNPLCPLV